MNPADDEATEMHRLPFDTSTADRFLAGRVVPDDAPPGLRDLAMLIQAAKPPASADGGAVEDQVVAAFAAVVRTPVGASENVYEGKKRMLTNLLSIKVAAVAAAVVLGGGGAVAAAGSLPAPVQSVVSSGLTHVGISVPNPNSHASPHASLRGGNANSHASPHASLGAGNANSQASGHGNSGSASSANAYGQCTAWAAANKGTSTNSNSRNAQDSFPQLTADALAKDESIKDFCASVSRPSTDPTTSGSSDGSTGSGAPSGTPAGPPVSTPAGPPASTPAGPPAGTPAGPPAGTPSGSRSGAATTR
jgi:hypothetical protein